VRVCAREVGAAHAGRDEPQRDVLELHLDLRLQTNAERLGALGELAADRILVGALGVVEDQRRRGEPFDRGGLACADAVGGVLDSAQAARRVLREGAPRRGCHDSAPGADEEVGAERLLELADLLQRQKLSL